ncbi:hypothetical protein GCM10020221_24830 [Streptomyces thioluteus]|uniref:Uncharacterized protein n=1 Tax=Streptomyces thioluteus TaxID=66431 RepID=A0ABP6JE73_STRTU
MRTPGLAGAPRAWNEVLRSYALIMASTDYIQFFLTDVEVSWPVTPPW